MIIKLKTKSIKTEKGKKQKQPTNQGQDISLNKKRKVECPAFFRFINFKFNH